MAEAAGVFEDGVFRKGDVRLSDRAGNKILPIGNDRFASVAETSVFIDKTMLIADVLDKGPAVTLFCRPRRFGKSLNLSMLQRFFEIPVGVDEGKNYAGLFEGLAIWDARDGRYRTHQGAYPVVRFTLNNLKSVSYPDFISWFSDAVAEECNRHDYLLESDRLSEFDKDAFGQLASGRADIGQLGRSLLRLTIFLQQHYGQSVVVLIDEYDAPVMAAHESGCYDEVVSFLKRWLTGALKSNDALAFAVLTGVQRISKESIFSDLNNLQVDTPLNVASDERFGFTQAEVEALAEYVGSASSVSQAREWYDGYRFGDVDVYNPWSVLNYFGNGCAPDVYWGNTSSNSVLGGLVADAGDKMLKRLYALAEPGGTVRAPLDTRVVFSDLAVAPQAVWSMLYLAGYLTTDDTALPGDVDRLRPLRIPNREVAKLYASEITGRFAQVAGGRDALDDLHRALVSGDVVAFAEELESVLLNCASFHDLVSENSYHMLMMGLLFNVPGYSAPVSNREAGRGRFDVQLAPADPARNPLITLELKHAEQPIDLELAARQALAQIDERAYDAAAGAAGSIRYGIAFAGKSAAVACEVV